VPGIVLLTLLASQSARGAGGGGCIDLAGLRKLEACELEQLFAGADPGPIPVGFGRGWVLCQTNTRMPRVKTRMVNAVWKGKTFDDDGCFINQWLGFKALDSKAVHGPSWYDGRPCIVLEYPPDTPLFANTRDELRQIGPDLYLGRLYERFPCPKFRGFLVLQIKCCRGCNPH
jgi:hypothetical protein